MFNNQQLSDIKPMGIVSRETAKREKRKIFSKKGVIVNKASQLI